MLRKMGLSGQSMGISTFRASNALRERNQGPSLPRNGVQKAWSQGSWQAALIVAN